MRSSLELDPQAWARLRSLLEEALDLPASQRQPCLARLDPADAALRPRLLALLAHADDDSVLERLSSLPQIGNAGFAHPPGGPSIGVDDTPDVIGPYRLLRELGSGGMASVWLAERTDMLRGRPVALKLPHGAWRRAGLAERMTREREILATLHHPNIATLYDAGLDKEGQPYLALEYVEGERIDAYVRCKHLDVPDTLKLFLQVARAVAHAHAQLVVHRDLKPSNLLVTADGSVKLLDFGIAKMLDQDAGAESPLTQQTGRALTPDYAAPEQIRGLNVGTPADVYGLGVVLYELLVGTRPYTLAQSTRAQLEEAILHADATPPSRAAPATRRRRLRGDLDSIVLKALAKDPAQRYPTAHALADDIERHLAQRPVLAQPDHAGDRVVRFVRRNRLVVAATATVVGTLAVGAGVATWQAAQATAAQHRAEAVKAFVTRLLTDADPFATTSRQPSVEGLLYAALARLQALPAADVALRVELLEVVGSALSGLGRHDRAARVLDQAIEEGTRGLGVGHRLTLRARLARTSVHRAAGRAAAMKAELDDLLPRLRASAPAMPEELTTAVMHSAHLAIDNGRIDDARAAAREALALAEARLGPLHPLTAEAALLVVTADQFGGDPAQVLASATRALSAVSGALPGQQTHARVLDARFIHGRALGNAGQLVEAVAALEAVLRDVREKLGDEAPMAGFVAADLARFELAAGHADTSLTHAQQALSLLGRVAQADSVTMAMARVHLGRAQLALHHADDARASFEQARAALAAAGRRSSDLEIDLTLRRAVALALLGRQDEAAQDVDPLLEPVRSLPRLAQHHGLLHAGMVKRMRGELDVAQGLLDEALALLTSDPVDAARRAIVQGELAQLWLARGAPDRALDLLPRDADPTALPRTASAAQALTTRGRALLALRRPTDAQAPLAQAAAFWRQHAPGSRWEQEAAGLQRRALKASR